MILWIDRSVEIANFEDFDEFDFDEGTVDTKHPNFFLYLLEDIADTDEYFSGAWLQTIDHFREIPSNLLP